MSYNRARAVKGKKRNHRNQERSIKQQRLCSIVKRHAAVNRDYSDRLAARLSPFVAVRNYALLIAYFYQCSHFLRQLILVQYAPHQSLLSLFNPSELPTNKRYASTSKYYPEQGNEPIRVTCVAPTFCLNKIWSKR